MGEVFGSAGGFARLASPTEGKYLDGLLSELLTDNELKNRLQPESLEALAAMPMITLDPAALLPDDVADSMVISDSTSFHLQRGAPHSPVSGAHVHAHTPMHAHVHALLL